MTTIKLTGFNTATARTTSAGTTDTLTTDGSMTIGDADTDTLIVNAEFDSHLIPDDDDTYDLGSAAKKWRTGYFNQVNAKQRDIKVAKYNATHSNLRFLRFNTSGVSSGTGAGNNTVFVAPADGSLLSLVIRTTTVAGSTSIAFHKAGDGTSLPINPWAATETEVIDIASANTSYQVNFSSSTFSAGEILGVSVDPTNNPNDVNITMVWLFDWNA